MNSDTTDPALRRQALLLLPLLLLCLLPSLFGVLIFDDIHSIVENTAIRSLRNIPAFFLDPEHFSSSSGKMYRPVVLTTLAIDHWLGRVSGAFVDLPLHAWPFKLGNVLQHLAVCLLLLGVLPRLVVRLGWSRREALQAGLLGTALFGLHPLHMESICLVSSRSEILAALGFLLALAGWLRFEGHPRAQALALAGGTAFACLSKEIGILVPPVVLLVELLLPAGQRRGRLLGRFALAVLVVVAYLLLRKLLFGVATTSLRSMHGGGDPFAGRSRDLATQLASMALFLPKAVWLWVFPGPLNLDHPRHYELGFRSLPVLAGSLFVLGSIASAMLVRRRRPLVTLGVLGATAFALPWILTPLNQPFAEHRLYLPLLFFSIPVAGFLGRKQILNGLARTRVAPAVRAGSVLVLLALSGLAARSVWRQMDWWSYERIWSAALAGNPRSYRACCGIGYFEIRRGRLLSASRYLERAHQIYPQHIPSLQNLLEALVRLQAQIDERHFHDRTVRMAEAFAERRPKDPFLRLLAGRARFGRHRISQDPVDLRYGQSWTLSPLAMVEPKMLVYRTAADGLRAAGRMDEALALFDASEERGLSNRELRAHKAEVLIGASRLDEARALIAELGKGRPFDPAVISLRVRYHAKRDDVAAWRREIRLLEGLGYAVPDLPVPLSLGPDK
ncbi:MAG: tetratricopeptide repeat protein [Planctomycetota bacterium]